MRQQFRLSDATTFAGVPFCAPCPQAPRKRKGTMASLGQAAIAPGISLGLLVVMAVTYTCSPGVL
jgi:hypothetical protein